LCTFPDQSGNYLAIQVSWFRKDFARNQFLIDDLVNNPSIFGIWHNDFETE
jgi:hypothetical protein